jgi:aminomethyltransferase
MTLQDLHVAQNAVLAADGIPLHYGDLKAEYHAALKGAVLMDRSHEGRLEANGHDRLELLHRISTNHLTNMMAGEGRPTIFTNANARILDRAFVYNRGNTALLIAEPGRSVPLANYLQRNVFFNDDFKLIDLSPSTRLFVLHGPNADVVMEAWSPGVTQLGAYFGKEITRDEGTVFAARRKPISGTHWFIVVSDEQAASAWSSLLEAGRSHALTPAGSLTYNTIRIRAGVPAIGRELSQDYIPLEAGLWDEVSFTKGCYTGQEIIARMESRNRLAKIMVTLQLSATTDSPADIPREGHRTGTLTSSVTTPDGEHFGIGFVKLSHAIPGSELTIDGIPATIISLAGAPPPQLAAPSVVEA